MPRVTIWIRNEDMPKWDAIENRPEWLHKQLNDTTYLHMPSGKVEVANRREAKFIGFEKDGEQYGIGEFKDGTVGVKLPAEQTYTPPEDVA